MIYYYLCLFGALIYGARGADLIVLSSARRQQAVKQFLIVQSKGIQTVRPGTLKKEPRQNLSVDQN